MPVTYRGGMYGPPAAYVNKDLEHLRLLSISHYIVGAITALVLSFPLIHVFLGLMFLLHPESVGAKGEQVAATHLFGAFFIVIGGAIVLSGWTLGALTIYAGRCLKQRKRWMFCVVVACLNCLHMPLGTILGVLTLIVLMRDSVRRMFQPGGFASSLGEQNSGKRAV